MPEPHSTIVKCSDFEINHNVERHESYEYEGVGFGPIFSKYLGRNDQKDLYARFKYQKLGHCPDV